MSIEEAELKKEFELERMILFSDAVFAIAITLLIIEIKFPEIEKGATTEEILHLFKPVAIRFAGFILSFCLIGVMWARHLKIFKYLKTYNNGIIRHNLVFLFFIVCLPFSASGLTEHIRPS
ncbi:MAG TPA: TMEM175 family protein, partial [Segetibacter sp.]